jgi:hypothetical protein
VSRLGLVWTACLVFVLSGCGCPEEPEHAFYVHVIDSTGTPLDGIVRLSAPGGTWVQTCALDAGISVCGSQEGTWVVEAEVDGSLWRSGPHLVGTDHCGLVTVRLEIVAQR